MTEHNPLRQPRRPRTIHQKRQIRFRIHLHPIPLAPSLLQNLREVPYPIDRTSFPDQQNMRFWDACFLSGLERDFEQLRLRDQDAGAAVFEVVGEFADGVGWVGGRNDAACEMSAPGYGGGVDAIRREEGEDLSFLEGEMVTETGCESDCGLPGLLIFPSISTSHSDSCESF
ncbi:hypothetical protein M7I_2576 [Glarea lozoyensis 74030]|uniref:Uncharacterized protein n=1 Tax=Glarea lozoyensis (strain ATCC 74030 / MF5533) TaxID=1104152 RepID=H0EJ52_GLAL7|nr:hypothetical protein M7I_2576 [Glarea lozoyensis 74030]